MKYFLSHSISIGLQHFLQTIISGNPKFGLKVYLPRTWKDNVPLFLVSLKMETGRFSFGFSSQSHEIILGR